MAVPGGYHGVGWHTLGPKRPSGVEQWLAARAHQHAPGCVRGRVVSRSRRHRRQDQLDTLRILQTLFGLHELAINDSLDAHQRGNAVARG